MDGYENLLNPDKLEGLSPKDLAAFSQLTPETEANTLGKLVTDSVWYYAVTVSGDTVSLFETGDSVDVFFDALSETLPMTVYSVGEIQNGEMVVVFRSSQNDSKVEDLRQESGRLIFQSDEGLRIPKEALRVNEDGETGVYVVLAQKARFRPVTVLAEDTDSYLVQANPTMRKIPESFGRETRSSWLPRNYMMERWYVDTMTETKSYETIAANVAAVREHMRQAALAAGRNPEDITLVAATKVQTSDTIRNAIRAGITICGENRVQELTAHLEDNAYEGAPGPLHRAPADQQGEVCGGQGGYDRVHRLGPPHGRRGEAGGQGGRYPGHPAGSQHRGRGQQGRRPAPGPDGPGPARGPVPPPAPAGPDEHSSRHRHGGGESGIFPRNLSAFC